MILFIKHIDIEGPDTFDRFLKQRNIETKTIELQNAQSLPGDLKGIDAVVSLGGPMNVYDEDKHSFLAEENSFLKKVLKEEIPFIGICLGSQLLAKACGAKVAKSPAKEIGFHPVSITGDGRKDPLFAGLKETIDVFHWHEDMSDLPSNAVLLASSTGCPHQAFKVGQLAYGIQFHFEVREATVGKWADKYFPDSDPSKGEQRKALIDDFARKRNNFNQTAQIIYNNFLNIVTQRGARKSYAK